MKIIFYLSAIICIVTLVSCNKEDGDVSFDATLTIDAPVSIATVANGEPVEFKFSTDKEVPDGFKLYVYSVVGDVYLSNETFSGQNKTVNISFQDKGTEFVFGQLTDGKDTLNSNLVEINVLGPTPVTLEPLTSEDNFITLQWSKSEASNFSQYVIFRNRFQPPNEYNSSHTIVITDQNQTSYTDEVDIMDRNFFYAVAIETEENCLTFSNIESIEPGNFVRLNSALNKILADPSRDYAYAISEDSKILAFDLNTMEKAAEFDPGYRVEDFDISHDHQYLYFSTNDFNQKQITQLSLPDLILFGTIPTEESPFKLEVGPQYIYYQRKPPNSGSSPLKRIEIATGEESGFGTSRHGDIELSSDGKYLFHVEGNISSPRLFRIETSSGNRIEQDLMDGFWAPSLTLAPNDQYLCYGEGIYDKDLNFVKAAEDRLYHFNQDGSLVLHRRQEVLRISDLTKVHTAPAAFEQGVFGKDDNYLILYVSPNNAYYLGGKLYRVNL